MRAGLQSLSSDPKLLISTPHLWHIQTNTPIPTLTSASTATPAPPSRTRTGDWVSGPASSSSPESVSAKLPSPATPPAPAPALPAPTAIAIAIAVVDAWRLGLCLALGAMGANGDRGSDPRELPGTASVSLPSVSPGDGSGRWAAYASRAPRTVGERGEGVL